MPYSLRSKITGLVYKGILSKEEGTRIREALEKQIPKKPIIAEMEWVSQPVECKCPTCGEYVCKYDTWAKATLKEHHCKCGQAIDWSDDND